MERYFGIKIKPETLKKAGEVAGATFPPLVLSGCTGSKAGIIGGTVVLGLVGAGFLLSRINTKRSVEIPLKERDKMKDYPAPVIATIAVMSVPKEDRESRQKEVLNIIREFKGKK